MRGRKIPYGYKMSNGRYVLEKKEAEIVKLVYEMTAAGKLPNETLKIVQNMDTEYFADDVDKRESKLSCLLRKEYYCGSGDYPAIISKECYDNARRNMSNRSHYYAEGKTKIPFKQTCCAICGGQLFRNRVLDDRIMEAEGVKRRSGSCKWEKGNVRSILKNEKYVGDSLLQKSYTQDCITHKRLVNYGARTK